MGPVREVDGRLDEVMLAGVILCGGATRHVRLLYMLAIAPLSGKNGVIEGGPCKYIGSRRDTGDIHVSVVVIYHQPKLVGEGRRRGWPYPIYAVRSPS
jgi:hypothetical protein